MDKSLLVKLGLRKGAKEDTFEKDLDNVTTVGAGEEQTKINKKIGQLKVMADKMMADLQKAVAEDQTMQPTIGKDMKKVLGSEDPAGGPHVRGESESEEGAGGHDSLGIHDEGFQTHPFEDPWCRDLSGGSFVLMSGWQLGPYGP
jgi:hypothetical protein